MARFFYIAINVINSFSLILHLGDSALGFIVAYNLYLRPENFTPSALTNIRSELVNNQFLAYASYSFGFPKLLVHMSPTLANALNDFGCKIDAQKKAIYKKNRKLRDERERKKAKRSSMSSRSKENSNQNSVNTEGMQLADVSNDLADNTPVAPVMDNEAVEIELSSANQIDEATANDQETSNDTSDLKKEDNPKVQDGCDIIEIEPQINSSSEVIEEINSSEVVKEAKSEKVDPIVEAIPLTLNEGLELFWNELPPAPKVAGDIVEAIIGAVFLDSFGDLEKTSQVIVRLLIEPWWPLFVAVSKKSNDDGLADIINPTKEFYLLATKSRCHKIVVKYVIICSFYWFLIFMNNYF